MPKLWTDTIEAHRREVRDAVLDTAAELIAETGLLSVTMSRIAEETGIGRATLYKYFPDVESILTAWHERQLADHVAELLAARDQQSGAAQRLDAVLSAYAGIRQRAHGHHGSELAAALHRGPHVADTEAQLSDLLQELLAAAVAAGTVRDDMPVDELATYCLHALASAADLPSRAAVRRLVAVTRAGLQPPR